MHDTLALTSSKPMARPLSLSHPTAVALAMSLKLASVQAVITCLQVPDSVPGVPQYLAHDTAMHNQVIQGPNSPGEDKIYRARIVPSNEVPGKNAKIILSNTPSGTKPVVDGTYIYSIRAMTTPPKGTSKFNGRGEKNGGLSFRFWLANLDTCEINVDLPGFDFNQNGDNSMGQMMVYIGAA
jgi:hypothetical protein